MNFKALRLEIDRSVLNNTSGADSSQKSTPPQDMYGTRDMIPFYNKILEHIINTRGVDITHLDDRYRDAVDISRISSTHIAQVGLGGIGSPTLQTLIGMGAKNYSVFDFDTVETHNCGPQLHRIIDIGKNKVDAAREQILCFRGVDLKAHHKKIESIDDLYTDSTPINILIGAVDNMNFRNMLAGELGFNNKLYQIKKNPVALVFHMGATATLPPLNIDDLEGFIFDVLNDTREVVDYLHKNKFTYINFEKCSISLGNNFKTMIKYVNKLIANGTTNNPLLGEEIVTLWSILGIINTLSYIFIQVPTISKSNFIREGGTSTINYTIIDLTSTLGPLVEATHLFDDISSELKGASPSLVISKYKQELKEVGQILNGGTPPSTPSHYNMYKLMNGDTLPDVYIDTRMSLGSWTVYTLPLKTIINYLSNGSEILQMGASLHTIKQYIPKQYNMRKSRLYNKLMDSLIYPKTLGMLNVLNLLANYTLEGLFNPEDGEQEPCTARAIVYTGFNIASYIGAMTHFLTSNWDDMMSNYIHNNTFEQFINIERRTLRTPFKWYQTFNSRLFI